MNEPSIFNTLPIIQYTVDVDSRSHQIVTSYIRCIPVFTALALYLALFLFFSASSLRLGPGTRIDATSPLLLSFCLNFSSKT